MDDVQTTSRWFAPYTFEDELRDDICDLARLLPPPSVVIRDDLAELDASSLEIEYVRVAKLVTRYFARRQISPDETTG
ncbi:hypothetical protein R3Q15_22420 [Gordonia amicalis]|uniref:Uncharacterized protein n=1 Tax=Gordonia amicalis TaxID=89053 RepID=A0AAE4RCP0_9ACTN|nr:hypothetical protein [Gordonia amicalis]MDV6314590.1 hypothetical protein [Gordonia amicalis]